MAKFLNTKKAVSAIEDLIKDADKTLILISPYLKLSKDFRELLTYRNSKDKVTTVIFGKQELKPDEMKFLESLRFVVLKYKDELHAKCYLNDEKMIITSLNLYDFSMANNKEMGVLIEKSNPNDEELFNDAFKEVDYINQTSERFAYRTQNTLSTTSNKFDSDKKSDKLTGYCIRCGLDLNLNPEQPLCFKCYKEWEIYSNPDYEEKFCHACGKESKTTIDKPFCYNCYKKI
ncbi:MAG TPA: phospholipase D family protein [Candidatus Methanoperedens sp.]